ncbi:hypothetical protein SDC9_120203 [bioreactor metagenome]|uniref:Uncharacterized protein n=1 Tax=bioreactor metagenome TaxID=1076179 RepID=A0A645C7Q0_9ZZZZ
MLTHTMVNALLHGRDSEYRIAGEACCCLSLPGLALFHAGERRMFLPPERCDAGCCFSISGGGDWTVYGFALGAAKIFETCISVIAGVVERFVRFRKFWDREIRRRLGRRDARKIFCLRL